MPERMTRREFGREALKRLGLLGLVAGAGGYVGGYVYNQYQENQEAEKLREQLLQAQIDNRELVNGALGRQSIVLENVTGMTFVTIPRLIANPATLLALSVKDEGVFFVAENPDCLHMLAVEQDQIDLTRPNVQRSSLQVSNLKVDIYEGGLGDMPAIGVVRGYQYKENTEITECPVDRTLNPNLFNWVRQQVIGRIENLIED